ncbi:chemotaxis response regulator protein-glutamate methylesterase [Lysobacter sp. H21R4]|uniref:protein-glutamate methylesterase/protein-glutamine glutaminase n=1 Tax=Lysobacter sp. H21R4 TaxID=2781021 RepID=UPI001887E2A3|nr:chemotaxis response regulator protein-glutamate methylesterase [Lysobacter sp. H21R4]QOY63310.1 chemotaxis response regulator protein-glutamate methylesterase [Lysobacter sp. H21R4]
MVLASAPPLPPSDGQRVRVLVIDDSAFMRRLMSDLLSADPLIEVVGTAADPFIARTKIKRLSPDVLTLDVEMPRMDGLSFLQNLMRLRPMPVVMVSTLTAKGAEVTLDALAAGAVDCIGKPQTDLGGGLAAYGDGLREKVRHAARTRIGNLVSARPVPLPAAAQRHPNLQLIAIGASTGGTNAILDVLSVLPADAPPIVIAQHIPAAFSAAFAARLHQHSAVTVVHAETSQPLRPGHAYVAPGGVHLRVARRGASWHCNVSDDAQVNGHRPSVDVLFESVANHVGSGAAAALLTGMGSDGARGLLALRNAGAYTLAQDQHTSIVWGMPGAAVALGAAVQVAPLNEVASRLLGRGNLR